MQINILSKFPTLLSRTESIGICLRYKNQPQKKIYKLKKPVYNNENVKISLEIALLQ